MVLFYSSMGRHPPTSWGRDVIPDVTPTITLACGCNQGMDVGKPGIQVPHIQVIIGCEGISVPGRDNTCYCGS